MFLCSDKSISVFLLDYPFIQLLKCVNVYVNFNPYFNKG